MFSKREEKKFHSKFSLKARSWREAMVSELTPEMGREPFGNAPLAILGQ